MTYEQVNDLSRAKQLEAFRRIREALGKCDMDLAEYVREQVGIVERYVERLNQQLILGDSIG